MVDVVMMVVGLVVVKFGGEVEDEDVIDGDVN